MRTLFKVERSTTTHPATIMDGNKEVQGSFTAYDTTLEASDTVITLVYIGVIAASIYIVPKAIEGIAGLVKKAGEGLSRITDNS